MMSACSTSTYSSQGEAWNEQVLEVRRVSISDISVIMSLISDISVIILYMCVYNYYIIVILLG